MLQKWLLFSEVPGCFHGLFILHMSAMFRWYTESWCSNRYSVGVMPSCNFKLLMQLRYRIFVLDFISAKNFELLVPLRFKGLCLLMISSCSCCLCSWLIERQCDPRIITAAYVSVNAYVLMLFMSSPLLAYWGTEWPQLRPECLSENAYMLPILMSSNALVCWETAWPMNNSCCLVVCQCLYFQIALAVNSLSLLWGRVTLAY